MAEVVFLLILPAIVGVVFALCLHRRDQCRLPCVVGAPFVSAFAVSALIWCYNLIDLALRPAWRNSYPIYVQAMGGALLAAPGMLIYGAIPATVGFLVVYLGTRLDT